MADGETTPEEAAPPDKRMRLRYAGTCRLCGAQLDKGEPAIYERSRRTVRCIECPTEAAEAETPAAASPDPGPGAVPVQPGPGDTSGPQHQATPELPSQEESEAPQRPESGVAGASARREYERRRAKDEARLREKWGRFGGIAVRLADERQSTRAWDSGALGEERVGARLDTLASESVAVLHDRRIPRSRANIDHLVITSGGVWVVDAKRYRGRPDLKVEGGFFSPRVEKLTVGGRDKTTLVDGVLRQMEQVRAVLGEAVPIRGALCFIEADWPLVGGAFQTRGVQVVWPKRLVKLVREDAGAVNVTTVAALLAERFTSA